MTDDALWDELRRIAQAHKARDAAPAFEQAYAEVARCLTICHRLGVDHPGVALLSKDAFAPGELDDFFAKTWRLAVINAEERAVSRLEARGGVDDDARDLERRRDMLTEARGMILDFGWLGEDQKRRCLDQLEMMSSDLQRARNAFDVALAGIDDPSRAAIIEINHRPGPLGAIMQRLFGSPGAGKSAPPPALPKPGALRSVDQSAKPLPAPKSAGGG